MSLNLSLQQVFSWTAQLSAQQDYQALTHKFLDILAEIPWINNATAYEIYNHERKKSGGRGLFTNYYSGVFLWISPEMMKKIIAI
jgi:hypothetical protein